MSIQESGEMYLETILILSREKSKVRAVDISEYMNYSKPSVSRAMSLLKDGGYILVGDDGSISLTEEGAALAEMIYDRHTTITDFLTKIGVDEATALDDACKIEHVISKKSFAALKEHTKDL